MSNCCFRKASREGLHGVVKFMRSPTPCGHADLSRHLKTRFLFSPSETPVLTPVLYDLRRAMSWWSAASRPTASTMRRSLHSRTTVDSTIRRTRPDSSSFRRCGCGLSVSAGGFEFESEPGCFDFCIVPKQAPAGHMPQQAIGVCQNRGPSCSARGRQKGDTNEACVGR